MNRAERNKLYDWLENGKVDVYLRRLMRERLAELEALLSPHAEVMQYDRPERRHSGAAEALGKLAEDQELEYHQEGRMPSDESERTS